MPSAEAITLRNKSNLIQELIYNETVRTRLEVIQEFKKGLEALGFFSFISKHPDHFLELLRSEREAIGPEQFKSLLDIQQPRNHAEQQAFTWFDEFVSDGKLHISKEDLLTRLEALMQFATSWRIPERCGLAGKIKVEFLPDDDEHTLPTASACLCIIRLPTVHSSKEKFEEAMLIALRYARHGFPNP